MKEFLVFGCLLLITIVHGNSHQSAKQYVTQQAKARTDVTQEGKSKAYQETFGFETEEKVPGSNWCGKKNPGDRKLGRFRKLDECCKTHSNCPLVVHSNKTRWGISNDVSYTLYDCKCDDAFYACLKKIKKSSGYFSSGLAWLVGKGYFNIYQTPCIVIPDGVNRDEQEAPLDTSKGYGPDVAYRLPNKDNDVKAYLRKAKKY